MLSTKYREWTSFVKTITYCNILLYVTKFKNENIHEKSRNKQKYTKQINHEHVQNV